MPELPDVENFKKYVERNALHRRITSVDFRNTKILDSLTPGKLQKALIGTEFTEAIRNGKHLFIRIKRGNWLTLHFGMTGYLQYFTSMQDDPLYDRVCIAFYGDTFLAFVDMRMFGRIGLTGSPFQYINNHHLGIDALLIDRERFMNLVASRCGAIKTVLMDQSLLSGIGNEYGDEILFQAKVHPEQKACTLKADTLKEIYSKMREVLNVAISAGAEKENFPNTFILKKRKKGSRCPRCTTVLETVKINGRTSYYCPVCQL